VRETVLRVFAFEPSRPGLIDTALRDLLAPRLCARPGIVDVCLGRQGPDEVGERFVASIWESTAAMEAGADELSVLGEYMQMDPDGAPRANVLCRTVAIDLRFERSQPARIMRVFRGEVRDGELDSYLEEVRKGALADGSANPGLVALYLGVEPPSRFLTVSTWVDWESIAASTGGNIHEPISTAMPERIKEFTAAHYEIVPETARPSVDRDVLAAAS